MKFDWEKFLEGFHYRKLYKVYHNVLYEFLSVKGLNLFVSTVTCPSLRELREVQSFDPHTTAISVQQRSNKAERLYLMLYAQAHFIKKCSNSKSL